MTAEPEYSGGAWESGPALVYDPLAEALVATCPIDLTGVRVLDIGAGTGAVSRAVLARGGCPVGVDVSLAMLHAWPFGPTALAGDATALPFPGRTFDVAAAAFLLSHVADPSAVLAEAVRVVRCGGVVLTVGFAGDNEPGLKAAVDSVLQAHGYSAPPWYEEFKRVREPRVATPERLACLASAAGLVDVQAGVLEVDTATMTTTDIVAWRVGMAHIAPFLEALDAPRQASCLAALHDAFCARPRRLRFRLAVMAGRAPA